jgi:hypothetical protein
MIQWIYYNTTNKQTFVLGYWIISHAEPRPASCTFWRCDPKKKGCDTCTIPIYIRVGWDSHIRRVGIHAQLMWVSRQCILGLCTCIFSISRRRNDNTKNTRNVRSIKSFIKKWILIFCLFRRKMFSEKYFWHFLVFGGMGPTPMYLEVVHLYF